MHIVTRVINLLFPQVCLNCSYIIPENEDLCDECYQKIDFLNQNYCNLCGCIITNNTNLCGKCIADPPSFSRLRSAFAYNADSKNMIISLKFFDNINYVKTYAKWMYEKNGDIFVGVDSIVPVPLHRWRLFQRKYNQAALLAKAVSCLSNIPCQIFAVKRSINTHTQTGLSTKQREANVKRAFVVTDRDVVRDKILLLIDDVVTTGATVKYCAQALKSCGAAEVRVLTLARTTAR
ncbi:ComF family protein [Candidatus Mesenet endosymbiont of Agriotes lineatus]|uniref:ComF family protein n=1 Tax=Candidatus Mesenet endosymbiont of Agriotes lineatus TaxID=3077948 RepID=UPI0030D4850E